MQIQFSHALGCQYNQANYASLPHLAQLNTITEWLTKANLLLAIQHWIPAKQHYPLLGWQTVVLAHLPRDKTWNPNSLILSFFWEECLSRITLHSTAPFFPLIFSTWSIDLLSSRPPLSSLFCLWAVRCVYGYDPVASIIFQHGKWPSLSPYYGLASARNYIACHHLPRHTHGGMLPCIFCQTVFLALGHSRNPPFYYLMLWRGSPRQHFFLPSFDRPPIFMPSKQDLFCWHYFLLGWLVGTQWHITQDLH